MLFAPDAFMLAPPDPLWREVQAIGPALLTRRAGMFARYARRQADQYGVKGERAAAARQALAVLTQAEDLRGTQARLASLDRADRPRRQHSARRAGGRDRPGEPDRAASRGQRSQSAVLRHDSCGPHHAGTLVASYGDRTAEAERHDGVDWKALSHAVRVGREAIELFTTGRLQFPLACAPHLLAIKLGQVPHSAVIAEIEAMLAEVERAAAMSTLPDEPDVIAAETLVCRAYRAQVLEADA